jgi:hypothetical protein
MAPAVAVLPLIFMLEHLFVPATGFDTTQSITINAPAEAVWRSVLRMDRIDEPLALPQRLGVAYPIHGESTRPGASWQLDFTEYGADFEITAPENVVELDQAVA